MPAQKPRPNRQPLPHILNIRISLAQYRHLLLQAERHGVSTAAAAREILDAAIDAQPRTKGDIEMSYRSLLLAADDATLEQLAHDLPADAVGTSDDHAGAGGSA
jgi:plasmid stability protein